MPDLYGSRYLRMDQVTFFKGCLPQILLGPFLNTLAHMSISLTEYYCRHKCGLAAVTKKAFTITYIFIRMRE